MEIVKVCHYLGCGKEFVAHFERARFCPECRIKRDVDRKRAARERQRIGQNAKTEKRSETLTDIAIRAKEAGMSYGEYVAKRRC